jgi:hypothetical protein
LAASGEALLPLPWGVEGKIAKIADDAQRSIKQRGTSNNDQTTRREQTNKVVA